MGWPARPIVVGRFGFHDEGRVPTAADDKAIGDLTWNVGEGLGGVVLLVAWTIIGLLRFVLAYIRRYRGGRIALGSVSRFG